MSDSLARKRYADLRIQAMIFDMDVDIETWQLVPKSTYKAPQWVTNWKAKQQEADNDEYFDMDKE